MDFFFEGPEKQLRKHLFFKPNIPEIFSECLPYAGAGTENWMRDAPFTFFVSFVSPNGISMLDIFQGSPAFMCFFPFQQS